MGRIEKLKKQAIKEATSRLVDEAQSAWGKPTGENLQETLLEDIRLRDA